MSSPQKYSGEPFNLSSWTLISSQGDILATDCDSESSESSIEVVSLEGSEIVAFSSHHLERKKYDPDAEENARIPSDEVVVRNISPSASLTDQESLASSFDCIQLQKPAPTVDDANTITQNADVKDNLNKKLSKQYETESLLKSYSVADHDFKQRDNEDESYKIKHKNDDEDTQILAIVGDTSPARNGDVPMIKPLALKLNKSNDKPCDEPQDQTQGKNINDDKSILKEADIINDIHLNNCEMQAACCLELLAERKEFSTNLDTQFCTSNPDCSSHESLPSSPSVTFEESSILHLLRDSANLNPTLAHNDSDADSDFVRLDSDHPGLDEGNGRIVVMMDRSDSSIGPTFSFMPNETSHEEESPVRRILNPEQLGREDTIFVNSEDLDRDDDTESSTEDGVDDRIESEQSEADSFSFNNDVGDLSVFADIGDLPLDVGNVPRNYIHCPNNHLSTILNIIVIIAAILTMGISLGIIMATDLEIEEWQNAYEVQNNKVYLLELQLQGKIKALEYKEKRLKELEPQLRELKSVAKMFKVKTNSYETAMELLIEDSLRKESTQEGFLFLRKALEDFMNCEKSNLDGSKACHLKVLAFSEHYIVVKNTSIPEESKHLSHTHIGNSLDSSQDTSKVTLPNEETDDIEMNPRASAIDYKDKQDFKLVDSMTKAFPIPLDIRHLQQTLTSEQQRALHWQQLYLAERRQRERERENEEWEDERDRELWEHEKEQLDQVECLKKLLSANMTMFAQHMGRWNLSLFDDFANLSLLLSGVAQLKQSVLDSIQRVWEGTGLEIENPQNERIFQESIADKKMLYNYVNEILNEIKDWPDMETLVEYLWKKVSEVKQVLEYMGSKKIWNGADHIIDRFDDIKYDTENNALSWFQIIELITQAFTDLKQELNTEGGEVEDYGKTSRATLQEHRTSKDHFQIKAVGDFSSNKGDGKKNSWHKQLGKIIKKTGVTVGEKVKRTWRSIKSLWHNKKSTWQNLKKIWNEEKPSIINMAKGFKNRVMNVSSKFKKLCTYLPKALFREGKDMVDMHSKCVYKARKQWQKDVYRDPCTVLGMFTAECNDDRKKIKKNLKRINIDFTQLLKIANVNHFKVVKDKKRVDAIHDQFKDFQKKWGSSKLLLKTDLDWVDCQSSWWLTAAKSMHTNHKGLLEVNKCDQIRLQDNLNKEHCGSHLGDYAGQRTGNLKSESAEELDGNDIKNVLSASENKVLSNEVDGDDTDYSRLNKNNNHLEVNDTQPSEEDWFLERARYKLQTQREKERFDKGFKSAAETREEKDKWLKMDGGHPQSNWFFKKSQYRENKRKEEHRADWLLKRSGFHLPCNEFNDNCEAAFKYSQHQYKSSNWYLKQGEERHKIRKQQGASDWVFERAAHRKKMHKTSVNLGPFHEKESFKPFDNQ